MPWHWYWTSALPRALTAALPLSAAGMLLEPQLRGPSCTVLSVVAAMSFLGHKEVRRRLPRAARQVPRSSNLLVGKTVNAMHCTSHHSERFAVAGCILQGDCCLGAAATLATARPRSVQLRFILPILPFFNVPAARALGWLWRQGMVSRTVAAHSVLTCAAVSAVFAAAAHHNYPGVAALTEPGASSAIQSVACFCFHCDPFATVQSAPKFASAPSRRLHLLHLQQSPCVWSFSYVPIL